MRHGAPRAIEKLDLASSTPWEGDEKWEVLSLPEYPFLNMWCLVCPLNESEIFLLDSVSPYNETECIMMGATKRTIAYVFNTHTNAMHTAYESKLSLGNPLKQQALLLEPGKVIAVVEDGDLNSRLLTATRSREDGATFTVELTDPMLTCM